MLAGIGGIVANVLTEDQLSNADRSTPERAIEALERSNFQVGVIAGWIAIVGLLVLAAGWWRLARARADEHLAWTVVPFGFLAAASSLLLGYGIKGALAEYLPGGANEDNFPAEGVYSMFVFHDNAPWVGWWGVVFAAAAVAWLAFRVREALPIWLGVLSVLVVLHAVVIMVVSGAVAIAGLTGPIWVLVSSIWLLVGGAPHRDEA
jgi:hypothetical protein